MKKQTGGPSLPLKLGLWIILAGYAFVLCKIVLFKYGLATNMRSFNFIPFRFVFELLHPATSLGVGLKNVLGNFAIFIPLGVLAPALFSGIKSWWRAALVGLFVSAAFELVQGLFGLGAADIDDLILNTLGAAAGGGLYFGLFTGLRVPRRPQLAALLFLCLFGLIGLAALWLFAPGELPQTVHYVNAEALDGLEMESYTLSAKLEGVDEAGVRCTDVYFAAEENGDKPAVEQAEYPLSEEAQCYQAALTYQFSPNGNIQKTTCTYSKIDCTAAAELAATHETSFAELWLDEDGACKTLLITVFPE